MAQSSKRNGRRPKGDQDRDIAPEIHTGRVEKSCGSAGNRKRKVSVENSDSNARGDPVRKIARQFPCSSSNSKRINGNESVLGHIEDLNLLKLNSERLKWSMNVSSEDLATVNREFLRKVHLFDSGGD